jgi:hypothetical protein
LVLVVELFLLLKQQAELQLKTAIIKFINLQVPAHLKLQVLAAQLALLLSII